MARTYYGPEESYGVQVAPRRGGIYAVSVGWREESQRHVIACGHEHRNPEAAESCAAGWRRRIAAERRPTHAELMFSLDGRTG